MRTCVGCGSRRPQDELVRLSAGSGDALAVGARSGRGAYLCPDRACVEQAVRKGAIARRLRAPVDVPSDLGERVERGLAGGRRPLG
jgi:predicted RNA-binding protein YlxR (DUF448 family)